MIVEIVLVIEIAMVLPGLLLRTLSQSFEGRERGERENTGGNWRAHGTTATPFTAATATNAWTVARRRAWDMIVSVYCKAFPTDPALLLRLLRPHLYLLQIALFLNLTPREVDLARRLANPGVLQELQVGGRCSGASKEESGRRALGAPHSQSTSTLCHSLRISGAQRWHLVKR